MSRRGAVVDGRRGDAAAAARLAAALDAELPQTQCTRCGYDDCRAYAEAIALDAAPVDRCPPGGAEGIARLAALTGSPVSPLDPACGTEGPRRLAVIDEAACIGCRLCLKACPVDAIVGGPKSMHTVVDADCTGCELCLPVCPVDCIHLAPSPSSRATGWQAWSEAQASAARQRYRWHRHRLARDADERQPRDGAPRRATAAEPVPAVAAPTTVDAALTTPAASAGAARSTPSARSLVEQALARARARTAGSSR